MGSMFGGKKGPGPQIDAARTDYRQAVLDRTKDSRENTLKLMSELEAQSQGEGPSLGTQQLVNTTNRTLAQTLAAAQAQRGVGTAGTKRQLVNQRGQAQRNVAEQGAMIRQQEAMGAQDALAQLSQQQQAEDLQQVMQPGAVVSSAESTRYEQAIKQAEIDARSHGKEGAAIGGLVGAIGGGIVGGIGGGPGGAYAGATAGAAIGGGLGGAAGTAMSDERAKKNVKPAKADIQKFLDAIAAKSYRYKDTEQPGTAPGKRFGVMAQDMEKSDIGASLVEDTPQGKMVNTDQGFGALLASQAELHKRLKKLEKGKK